MISIEEMPVVLAEGGMTIRCLEKDGGKYWSVTRKPGATDEAVERVRGHLANVHLLIPVSIDGTITYRWFSQN